MWSLQTFTLVARLTPFSSAWRLVTCQSAAARPAILSAQLFLQVANMERQMTTHNFTECSIPAARCFYRAASELLQQRLDANESPNGEATRGSQRYRNLMVAVKSFIRAMSSWAQMEFTQRLACSAHVSQPSITLLFGLVSLAWDVQHRVPGSQTSLLPRTDIWLQTLWLRAAALPHRPGPQSRIRKCFKQGAVSQKAVCTQHKQRLSAAVS